MPPTPATLAYLFTERPLIERFAAAAGAGFRAVELQFPYDHAPSAVKAELDRHRLTMLGIHTPPAPAFRPVQLQFPYDHAPSAVKAELDRHGLTMLGINTAPGQATAGEFGVAAVPGREQDFATLFRRALDYVTAIGGCQIHCLAGKVPPEARAAAEMTLIKSLMLSA